MKIFNKSNNKVLAENVEVAAHTFSRMRGLLGRNGLKSGEALIIRHCASVHTFFMRFTIDVVFVDRNSRVVKAVPRLKPWRITPFYAGSSFCIELPEGAIEAASIDTGTELIFSEN